MWEIIRSVSENAKSVYIRYTDSYIDLLKVFI